MSSLIRRIERQLYPSHAVHTNDDGRTFYRTPPREKFYQGRGRKLGVKNPQDAALLARLRREARRQPA